MLVDSFLLVMRYVCLVFYTLDKGADIIFALRPFGTMKLSPPTKGAPTPTGLIPIELAKSMRNVLLGTGLRKMKWDSILLFFCPR